VLGSVALRKLEHQADEHRPVGASKRVTAPKANSAQDPIAEMHASVLLEPRSKMVASERLTDEPWEASTGARSRAGGSWNAIRR
jgi:hypothetical protein